jgi:hypothetical protein
MCYNYGSLFRVGFASFTGPHPLALHPLRWPDQRRVIAHHISSEQAHICVPCSLHYHHWITSRLTNLAILYLESQPYLNDEEEKKKSRQPIKPTLMAIWSWSYVADSLE